MIVTGLGMHALESMLANDWNIFGITLTVTAATFMGAYVLYKIGVWAGGDVKLFTGIAALNPFNPAFFPQQFNYTLALNNENLFGVFPLPIYPFTLFLFSVFSTLPYTALLGLNALRSNQRARTAFMETIKKAAYHGIAWGLVITGFTVLLQKLGMDSLLLIPLLLITGLLTSQQKIFIGLAVVLGVAGFAINGTAAVGTLALLVIGIFALECALGAFGLARKFVLRKTIPVKELKEGDILVDTWIERQGSFIAWKGIDLEKVLKHVKANTLAQALEELRPPKGNVTADPHNAGGLSEEQVKKLQHAAQNEKMPRAVEVKLTAPFAPAVLIAYVITNTIGDALWIALY